MAQEKEINRQDVEQASKIFGVVSNKFGVFEGGQFVADNMMDYVNMQPSKGNVYMITDGEFFKVGYTENPPQGRLAQLQTGNPKKLELFFFAEKYHAKIVEEESHEYASYIGERVNGEWFILSEQKAKELTWFIDGYNHYEVNLSNLTS